MKNRKKDKLREAGRILRSVIRPTATIQLLGNNYKVGYEARKQTEDRDYPFLWQLAKDKQFVFDVGANKGMTSLLLSSAIAANGNVYAFEASEKACRLIRENIYLNNLADQIQVINTVIAAQSGRVIDFYWSHISGGASVVKGYLGHGQSIKKSTMSLDDFVAQIGVYPDIVKIDVEGAEAEVIGGMKRLLQTCQPTIMVELHSWQTVNVVDNAQKILSILAEVNYSMIYLRTQTKIEDATILARRGRCHVLLMPSSQCLPDWMSEYDTSNL